MKVTGYQLREALRRWIQRVEMAKKMFKDSSHAFKGETKNPVEAGNAFFTAGETVAVLQSAQQQYNQMVLLPEGFSSRGRRMTLALAVKLIGHAGSYEKEWRVIVTGPDKRHSYVDDARQRSKDNEYAEPTIADTEALAHAERAGSVAADLRAAIAVANGTEIEMDLDPELFQR